MKTYTRTVFASALLGTSLLTGACSDGSMRVGFFGAQSNSYAQGTFAGVEATARANNATATFVDTNFDSSLEKQRILDAISTKAYDVIVIQAADNLNTVAPLEAATAAGITVVVEAFVVGPDLAKLDPQVKGAISVVGLTGPNGEALAQLGIDACASVAGTTCNVAYLEGFRSLALDTVRTEAVKKKLATSTKVNLVASVEGGYTVDSGKAAFQTVRQANPNLHVVIGSSQAILGAASVAGTTSGIKFIGNGGSKQAVAAVLDGSWYATYVYDVFANGKKATELGLAKARGQQVATATDQKTLAPNNGIGTKEALTTSKFVATYSD